MTDIEGGGPSELEKSMNNFRDIFRVVNLRIGETDESKEILVIVKLADDTEHFLLMSDDMAFNLAGILEAKVISRHHRKQKTKGVSN